MRLFITEWMARLREAELVSNTFIWLIYWSEISVHKCKCLYVLQVQYNHTKPIIKMLITNHHNASYLICFRPNPYNFVTSVLFLVHCLMFIGYCLFSYSGVVSISIHGWQLLIYSFVIGHLFWLVLVM